MHCGPGVQCLQRRNDPHMICTEPPWSLSSPYPVALDARIRKIGKVGKVGSQVRLPTGKLSIANPPVQQPIISCPGGSLHSMNCPGADPDLSTFMSVKNAASYDFSSNAFRKCLTRKILPIRGSPMKLE